MMSTLSFTNLANICDTARFMAEKHIFMSTQNSKYQSTACFSFFSYQVSFSYTGGWLPGRPLTHNITLSFLSAPDTVWYTH